MTEIYTIFSAIYDLLNRHLNKLSPCWKWGPKAPSPDIKIVNNMYVYVNIVLMSKLGNSNKFPCRPIFRFCENIWEYSTPSRRYLLSFQQF